MKFYVNPGHDRELDSGAVNTSLQLRECDMAYELAMLVKMYLERHGMMVLVGQHDDLYAICEEANGYEADYFVSIHFNAFNKKATGTDTLVSGSLESLLLGHSIQANVKAVLCLPDRGIKERPGMFVLRNTVMPAVIVGVCVYQFPFPVPPRIKTRVGDILEEHVDSKYTISDTLYQGHLRRKEEHKKKGNGFGFSLFNADYEYTNTISARYYKDGSEILIDQGPDKNPRKLIPRECARLQGFPEKFIIPVSDTQAYKQFGNSVAVPVIRAIAKKMIYEIDTLPVKDNGCAD